MTLRFIVGRILRELIELAEHDAGRGWVDGRYERASRSRSVASSAGHTSGGAKRLRGAGRDRDYLAL